MSDIVLPERYSAALENAIRCIHEKFSPIGIVVSGTIIGSTDDPGEAFRTP